MSLGPCGRRFTGREHLFVDLLVELSGNPSWYLMSRFLAFSRNLLIRYQGKLFIECLARGMLLQSLLGVLGGSCWLSGAADICTLQVPGLRSCPHCGSLEVGEPSALKDIQGATHALVER